VAAKAPRCESGFLTDVALCPPVHGAPTGMHLASISCGAKPDRTFMSVLARLRPEFIRIAPPWHTFLETIEGLVEALVAGRAIPGPSRPAAVKAVVAREDEGSTALLDIAAGVPHARLADLPAAVMALAASSHGLYEPVRTVPIKIVALVLSPPAATTNHLQLLAEVATLLRSPELRAGLVAARDGSEAMDLIRRYGRAMP
jgi:nitrogen PTS system EIIA component